MDLGPHVLRILMVKVIEGKYAPASHSWAAWFYILKGDTKDYT